MSYVASSTDPIGRTVASANYGTNADSGPPTRPNSPPASSDTVLVSQTWYNDRGEAFETVDPAGTVNRTTYDRVEYRHNRQGQRIEMKDQNETVHEYLYDGLGRSLGDKVTVPAGSAVDQSVLWIGRTYDVRGLLETITSYDGTNPQSANVVNQCQRAYNGFGQLTEEQQQHDGPVTANSPKVEYSFTDGSSGHTRLTKITYPNERYGP